MGPDVENYGGHKPIQIKFPLKEEPVFNCPIQQELTSLRAQVEELSKYPEEAVRAVFGFMVDLLDEDGLRGDAHLALLYSKHKDKLAAIFKEKQGVGK